MNVRHVFYHLNCIYVFEIDTDNGFECTHIFTRKYPFRELLHRMEDITLFKEIQSSFFPDSGSLELKATFLSFLCSSMWLSKKLVNSKCLEAALYVPFLGWLMEKMERRVNHWTR